MIGNKVFHSQPFSPLPLFHISDLVRWDHIPKFLRYLLCGCRHGVRVAEAERNEEQSPKKAEALMMRWSAINGTVCHLRTRLLNAKDLFFLLKAGSRNGTYSSQPWTMSAIVHSSTSVIDTPSQAAQSSRSVTLQSLASSTITSATIFIIEVVMFLPVVFEGPAGFPWVC